MQTLVYLYSLTKIQQKWGIWSMSFEVTSNVVSKRSDKRRCKWCPVCALHGILCFILVKT